LYLNGSSSYTIRPYKEILDLVYIGLKVTHGISVIYFSQLTFSTPHEI